MPKALVDNGSGPWVRLATEAMAGCDARIVVVGGRADEVAALVPAGVAVVRNEAHAEGMGSSLALGLSAVGADTDAALVMLVDLPDVTVEVVDRVLGVARSAPDLPDLLCRAAFRGRPGHPVIFGRNHLAEAAAGATGDSGARDYLAGRAVQLVECGDLAGGHDVDRPG